MRILNSQMTPSRPVKYCTASWFLPLEQVTSPNSCTPWIWAQKGWTQSDCIPGNETSANFRRWMEPVPQYELPWNGDRSCEMWFHYINFVTKLLTFITHSASSLDSVGFCAKMLLISRKSDELLVLLEVSQMAVLFTKWMLRPLGLMWGFSAAESEVSSRITESGSASVPVEHL